MTVEITTTSSKYQGGYSDNFKGKKIVCDRCGFDYYKYEKNGKWIRKNRKGRWICNWCWDESD